MSRSGLGTVHVEVASLIHAAPERLAALYLDYTGWSRLFPATIRGVRFVRRDRDSTTVEVDHRTEGRVPNTIRPRSATEIELDESKPKFDATFLNRFEPVPEGTRYVVVADVHLRMPYALLSPFLRGLVRRTIRRYVLDPMKAYVEVAA